MLDPQWHTNTPTLGSSTFSAHIWFTFQSYYGVLFLTASNSLAALLALSSCVNTLEDVSFSKAFNLGFGDSRLRFRWDIFNLTNTPSYDVYNLIATPDRAGFGRYDGTHATCDALAGRCMQFALRFEF